MRIAFDGRALRSPAAGVRRYARELFGAIARLDSTLDVLAVGARADETVPAGVRAVPAAFWLPTNLGWSAAGLPLAVARSGCDVFHAPAYTAPLWDARPLVLTIHDVSYARRPEWTPRRAGVLRRAFYRASARRADCLVTDSAFSRDEIVAAYGVNAGRIHVVPLGVSAAVQVQAREAREAIVLHVGDLHRRRNLGVLLEAVLALRAEPSLAAVRLVLAGVDRGVLDGLRQRARAAGQPQALDYRGTPGDDELARLYGRAAVFGYPSLYEGFGLPVLEAMASGVPVVASSRGAVPEVVGDAGLVVAPEDARAWRDALRVVLTDADRARDLAARGSARAASFTWERAASATLAVYAAAIRSRRRHPSR